MKVCIVTGVTGTLGSELVSKLKLDGYRVVGISRKESNIVDFNITCDFENMESEKVSVKLENYIETLENVESINFVHCAGYYQKEKIYDTEFNFNLCKKSFEINTFSFYLVVNILANLCNKFNVGSSVIAVSSNLTKKKNTLTVPYISSKFALEGMVEAFAQTYGKINMRFNTVCPGMFASNMNNYSVPDAFIENTPLKRLGKIEDIIDSIMFLLSDNSKCVTANKILIDGGGSNGY